MSTRVAPGERELWILRHGKAEGSAPSGRDFDRPLARRGRKDASDAGAWMKGRRTVPDLVVSSPAVRAKETALRAAEAAGLDPGGILWEPRIYEAELPALLRVLAELDDTAGRVLLVGHNPGLEDLVLHLGGDSVEMPADGKVMPTAALARFAMPPDWERLPPGAGRFLGIRLP